MHKFFSFYVSIFIALLTSISGCGGNSTGNSTAGIDGSGAPATVTTGTVNGFGSVIVNGVRYHSDKAAITVNGQLSNEDSLHTGYQVNVTGVLNTDGTGTATSIDFRPNVIGSITYINAQNEQLTVLGQTVQITNDTLFDTAINPNDLSGLKLGDSILVSGLLDNNGVINATRIELTTQISLQLIGTISNINEADTSFTFKNMSIHYNAASFNNISDNQLKNGSSVSITGNFDNTTGTFHATSITDINIQLASDVKNADIEGFITRFISSSDFDIAGFGCSTNTQTHFENGTANQLKLGARLKIKGSTTSDKKILAQSVLFLSKVSNQIAGEISNIATAATNNIASGSFQINNVNIKTNIMTNYEDNSNGKLKRFNFTDLHNSDFVKISGYNSADGFIASKIERREFKSENETALHYEGTIESIGTHNFSILGRNILIGKLTEIRGKNSETINESEFLAQALGTNVRVRGLLKNGVFIATKIEIREDD